MKHQNMTKNNTLSASDWIEILLFTGGWFGLDLFLQHRLRNILPAAFSGPDGLRQTRHYLIMWLLTRYVRILLPGTLFLLIGAVMRKIKKNAEKQTVLRPIAACILTAVTLIGSLQIKNRFELQCHLNGYRGTAGMQAAALLSDVSKDLHTDPGQPEAHPLRQEERQFSYQTSTRRASGRRTVRVHEFMLSDSETGELIAQISPAEFERAKEGNITGFRRSVAVYPNSGLIAAIDGQNGTRALGSCENMFTLTYSAADKTLRRTDDPLSGTKHGLTLMIQRGEERAWEINAENKTDFFLLPCLGSRAWLVLRIDGRAVRVSNEITF